MPERDPNLPSAGGEPDPDWFRRSFDARYVALYAHRDEREAEALATAMTTAGLRGPVLEVACGGGRFLESLAKRELAVTGLDLSAPLLAAARRRLGPGAALVRGDMRSLPFGNGRFRLVLFLFTSFGYFTDPAEDRRVLQEAQRVLAPGGHLLLDFFNAPRAVATLVPASSRRIGSLLVRDSRWIDPTGPYLRKRTVIEEEGREEIRDERVRLYRPEELEEIIMARGLRVTARWGSYTAEPFDPEESDRFLVLARKESR